MTGRPLVWLGAPSPGGLALPSAKASASHLYAPRGVHLDDERLIVADSGNHRVLIWFGRPSADHGRADVVLGQPSFDAEGPRATGRGPENGLQLPTGVAVIDGRLLVADAWHHRILVWNTVPERSGTPPDEVIGQPDLTSVEPNRGGAVTAAGLYWPYGMGMVNGHFYVADTGNRRVLVWPGVPEPGQPASGVIGQDDAAAALENRGGAPSASSFRWPHAIAGDGEALFVADAGNHRVLVWTPPVAADGPATAVIGQPHFAAAAEFPYAKQTAASLRFPYAAVSDVRRLAVADTANNRVLVWHRRPGGALGGADGVLGQPDLSSNGENRWKAVAHDTLCWPYGLALHGDRLAVADSGNNRVVVWELAGRAVETEAERSVASCA